MKALKLKEDLTTVFYENNALSGLVGNDRKLYLCAKAGAKKGGGHDLYSLEFDHGNSATVYNLHYAPVRLAKNSPITHIRDSTDLNAFASDYFVMVKVDTQSEKQLWTVICRSWKIRNKGGVLALLEEEVEIYSWPHC